MNTHADFRAWIERDARGALSSSRRQRLHDHLRACDACRGYHDDLALAFGALEGEPLVSRFELEQAGRWITDALPPPAPRIGATWRWLLPTLAVATALVLVVPQLVPQFVAPAGLSPGAATAPSPSTDVSSMSLTAKGGGHASAGAVSLYCGRSPAAVHPALPGGCGLDETLAFAYREPAVEAGAGTLPTGVLTLFGVENGRVQYYAPTPVDPGALPVQRGKWRAAPLSVRLAVNHAAGDVHVYALFSPRVPTTAQIDGWASSLTSAGLAGAAPADGPWHLRIPSDSLAPVCGASEHCQSAELVLPLSEESK